MKTKFTLLIVTTLLITSVSKAQYHVGFAGNGLVVRAHICVPTPVVVGYGYNNAYRYNDGIDWRNDEYIRYCRDHREYRGDRQAFYRDRIGYRVAAFRAPTRVVVYR